MRNVVWAIAMLVACGPSAAEVKTAKQTTYNGDPQKILELAIAAAQDTYKIEGVDRDNAEFITQARWYSAEGDLESPGAGGFLKLVDRSVQVGFDVKIMAADVQGQVAVVIKPKVFQYLKGSPQPRELAEDDPNMPPWVHGRVDALALAIYQRAKGFAVAPPGQSSPST